MLPLIEIQTFVVNVNTKSNPEAVAGAGSADVEFSAVGQ